MRCIQVLSALALRRLLCRVCEPAGASAPSAPCRDDLLALPGHHHVTRALRQANARAWLAVEVLLAGEQLWERAQLGWQRSLDETFHQPLRAFLDAAAVEESLEADSRRAAWSALQDATRQGLLTSGPLDVDQLLRSVELGEDGDDDCHDDNMLSGLADAVAATTGNADLRPLFKLAYAQRAPLIVLLVQASFVHAVEADADLFGDLASSLREQLDDPALAELRPWAAALDHERARIDALLREAAGPAEPAPQLPADAGDAKARLQRGALHLQRGELDGALAELSAALHLDPALAAAYRQRGDVYRLKGDYPPALADYSEALRLEPDNIAVLLSRGQVHWLSRQHAAAIADFSDILQREPRHAAAYHFRGKAYADGGDLESALADFGQAHHFDPTSPWACHDRADAFAALAQHDRAIEDYTRALRLNPQAVLSYTRRGDAYASKNDLDRAVADFNQALRLDPYSAAAYRKRGGAYRRLGKYDRAAADLGRALDLDETSAELYHERGVLFRQRGDYERAVHDLDAAIRLDPQNAELFYQRGEARGALADPAAALADLGEALRLDPRHARAYNARGLIHAARKAHAPALDDFAAAVRVEPAFALAHANLARSLIRIGRLDEAISACGEALRHDAGLAAAHVVRGSAWGQQGQYAQAVADFSRALELAPDDAQAFLLRGLAHFKEGRLPQALADLSAVIRAEPQSARAYAHRAQVLRAAQQHERALSDCALAARLDARHAPLYCEQLGLVHALRGDFERAAADYSLVLMLDPKNTTARSARDEAWKNHLARVQKSKRPVARPSAASALAADKPAAATHAGLSALETREHPLRPDTVSEMPAFQPEQPGSAEDPVDASAESTDFEVTLDESMPDEPAADEPATDEPAADEKTSSAAAPREADGEAYRREQELMRAQEEDRVRKMQELRRRFEEEKKQKEQEERRQKDRAKRKGIREDYDPDRMPLWKKGALTTAAGLALWFLGSWFMELRANSTARAPVTLGSICKAFAEDTPVARKKYSGGFFQLSGKGKLLKSGRETLVILEQADAPEWVVRCRFDMNAAMFKKMVAAKVEAGEAITVEGRCIYRPEDGLRTINMEDCGLVESAAGKT